MKWVSLGPQREVQALEEGLSAALPRRATRGPPFPPIQGVFDGVGASFWFPFKYLETPSIRVCGLRGWFKGTPKGPVPGCLSFESDMGDVIFFKGSLLVGLLRETK